MRLRWWKFRHRPLCSFTFLQGGVSGAFRTKCHLASVIEPLAISKPKLPKKPAKINRESFTITIEDISLRAYFIAERRKSHGLHGDETADWVEAERQLLIEAAKRLS